MQGKLEHQATESRVVWVTLIHHFIWGDWQLDNAGDKRMVWKGRKKNHISKIFNKSDGSHVGSRVGSHVSTAWRLSHTSRELMSWASRGSAVCWVVPGGRLYGPPARPGTGLDRSGRANGLRLFSSKTCVIVHRTRSSFSNLSPSLISMIAGESQERRHHRPNLTCSSSNLESCQKEG